MNETLFMKNECTKFQFFLDLVQKDKNLKSYKGGRKSVISNIYYLDKILFVLTSGISWSDLQYLNIKCHYTAIYKKYIEWTNKGFFNDHHIYLLNIYSKNNSYNASFIDSTDIRNINGSKKLAGYGRKFKCKRAIKLHTKCDKNKITSSIIITPANKPDVTQIEPLMENSFIPINATYRKPHYTVGDKGYISDSIYTKLRKQNIILTYPLRKNQKDKNSKYKKKLLKKRYHVEHSYNILKRRWKRIDRFYERKIDNYITFIIIANSIMITNFLLNSSPTNINIIYRS